MSQIKTIAVTGKGGTGKTMIATLIIHVLSQKLKGGVLAIDADSAMSLPYTLGLPVEKTISQMREGIVSPGQMRKQMEQEPLGTWIGRARAYGDGFDLIAMGRPEEPGCYCAVNELLRAGIDSLIDDYQIAIIDGEAGPEQLNRRVIKNIDVLLVVSDMSARSLATAGGIIQVAQANEREIQVGRAGLILNRVRDDEPEPEYLKKAGLDILGRFPEDKILNEYDRQGRPLSELPADSPCLLAVEQMLKELVPELFA